MEKTSMTNLDPKKNSEASMNDQTSFNQEIDSLFGDYIKNLSPESNSALEFDLDNFVDSEVNMIGQQEIRFENDPFYTDLRDGTTYSNINNPISHHGRWEDLEDDAHR